MEIEFKDASNPQAVVLGEIEIKGHRVFITTDSPPRWRRLVNGDDIIHGRHNTLGQSSVVSATLKTLGRVQAFDAVRQFDELAPKVRMLTAKRWKEIPCHNWRFDAANFFSGVAAKELGIERPKNIKFFREAKYGETAASFEYDCDLLRGMARQGTIWLNENLAGSDFIETVAHEVRHLWQPRAISDEQKAANERDALRWGQSFAARFKAIPPGAEIYIHPRFAEWDPDATHYDAPRGSWLFNLEDNYTYEHIDSRWWRRSNWKEMMQNVGS